MRPVREAAGVLAGALLLGGSAPAGRPPAAPVSVVRCWIDGDTAGALAALEAAPPGRERDLNRAVARLYAGEGTSAETELVALRRREPRWTPAVRWLARAQRSLARPEVIGTVGALLAMDGANARDHLWAGGLFLERGDLERARSAFQRAVHNEDGLDLGWLELAETEARLGHAEAARAAGERAGPLRASPSSPDVRPVSASAAELTALPSLPLRREALRYRVKYLFFRIASLTLEADDPMPRAGSPAQRVVFTAKSNPGIFFFHIDSRFETEIGADGAVLTHRHVADDSDSGADAAGYETDREAGRLTVRSVRDGLFGYDVLPLPPNAQDGVSVLQLARALARTRGSAEVPTAVDLTWKTTRLRTVGTERIRWHGRDVQTVRIQTSGSYRGPGGLSGVVDIWISDDERALPCKARMKVAVGSVGLELLPEEATETGAKDEAP
jgi:tetratricopeptide (TPR) repeat protein